MQLLEPAPGSMDANRRALTTLPPADLLEGTETATATTSTSTSTWIRHGWEDQHASEEYLNHLNAVSPEAFDSIAPASSDPEFFMYFTDKRHETGGDPRHEPAPADWEDWRMRQRLKTVAASLVLCLNLGVDPPDVVKTNPCAKLECWVDPTASMAGGKAMEQIGKNLQAQYESLSIRTRYKQHLDPSVDETKKFCCSLRRSATDERVLFHYNGHGVPKPTPSGEIWVFNKGFTQYIPISLYDLQTWLAAPGLFVYDCSEAGTVIRNFNRFLDKHETENAEIRLKDAHAHLVPYADCIQLGACAAHETLPTNPDLPADLFTCCLTTPIEISLRFFVLQNPLLTAVGLDLATKVPGRLQDRRSPLGELNWIFTAITDTVAWNCLPPPLFKKLFRQDLMVAALFRNFLLAQRIMRTYQCHPQSSPPIPDTHRHPFWESWDLALEMVIAQLPALLDAAHGKRPYQYQHSSFFAEQLTAFEVYLSHGAPDQQPPGQLPVVLQVLMSQIHRLRALVLLSKFLDLGPWAVSTALSIGIFTYVLRLLQSAAAELRPVLTFIWARILAVDQSCQVDLLKDNGYRYFMQILDPHTPILIPNVSDHRAMSAFILAMFCKGYGPAQVVCMDPMVLEACLTHLRNQDHTLLRQWACLCISQLWVDYSDAKWHGIREMAPQRLCERVLDRAPEVRAAMLYALTTFLGIPDITDQVARTEETLAWQVLPMALDCSSMVRHELLVFLSTFVHRYENNVVVAAYERLREDGGGSPGSRSAGPRDARKRADDRAGAEVRALSPGTIFAAVWVTVLQLSVDPHAGVARRASVVIDAVYRTLLRSALGPAARLAFARVRTRARHPSAAPSTHAERLTHVPSAPKPSPPLDAPHDFLSLRRTASIAATLKHLAFGGSGSHDPPGVAAGSHPPGPSTPASPAPSRPGTSLASDKPVEPYEPAPRHAPYRPAKVPPPARLDPLATAGGEWPLKSTFLAYSMEYFREPQMRPPEADEPGSTEYNQRLWRRARNDKIISMTQPQKEEAASKRWDVAAGVFENGSQPTLLCFHQFESHLAVADDRNTICIWDWQKQSRISRFANADAAGCKVNGIKFINEDDQAILMTGSSDGAIRLYKGYESTSKVTMISAWRALTDMVSQPVNAGLVFEWQQGQGKVLVAGDVKVIRVWNAATELCTTVIPARSGACITSLTSEQVAGHIFVAGFGDGALRVYDQRLSPRDAMVRVWKEHKEWIVNVHMQRGGTRDLISASRNGDVKLWDIRMQAALKTIPAGTNSLRTLSVHEHAPVFATGSAQHAIRVFNVDGRRLSSFEPHPAFLHPNRGAPIASTCFHPHRMMLACAALNDDHIHVYSMATKPAAAAAAAHDDPPLANSHSHSGGGGGGGY
ncbi:MAG: hypothetical protein M1826_003276 [Phylliscum demangeonii]|nr:MAG: hypothetical protein M1826_003276 [Phylliscum demangeonii]